MLSAEVPPGNTVPGFAATDAGRHRRVDALRLEPAWKTHTDLSELAGKVVRLTFHLRNARLYAFQIK